MEANPNTPAGNGENQLSAAELNLLEMVRQEDFSKVTIQIRQGKILNIETEADIPAKDLDNKRGVILVRNMADFESVTVSKHRGKLVKARRTRPMPLTDQDNAGEHAQACETNNLDP